MEKKYRSQSRLAKELEYRNDQELYATKTQNERIALRKLNRQNLVISSLKF